MHLESSFAGWVRWVQLAASETVLGWAPGGQPREVRPGSLGRPCLDGKQDYSGIRQLSGSSISFSQRGGLPRPVQVFSGSLGLRYFGLPGLRLRLE